MVFQKRMLPQQRRRRRPWLCGGGSDTDEVASPSTISKTLDKKRHNIKSTGKDSPVDSRTGSSCAGGDESSSSGNDSRDQIEMNIPAWKAENFLDAPLVEDDWWEDDKNDDDDDDKSSFSDSVNEKRSVTSSFDDDDDTRVANYIMRLQQQYSNATAADPASSWETTDKSIEMSEASTDNDSESIKPALETTKCVKRFCNRGLQTWYLARQKWLTTSDRSDTLSMKTKKPSSSSPILPETFRKELKQCLVDRRQFELSQSIPLSCVVDAYQEVWQENGCD